MLRKSLEVLRERGLREGVREVWDRGRGYFYDPNREIILLRADLTEAKFHLRERDQARAPDFRLLELDERTAPRVEAMLVDTEPARVPNVRDRLTQGMRGFVAENDGEVRGYVFWTPGNAGDGAAAPDLVWLPLTIAPDEVYCFDYFLPQAHRGLGNTFARAVQQRQCELGFRASYGYVYANNHPALWLYRTVGWREVGRTHEHKILQRFAIIEGRLFSIGQYERSPLLDVPSPVLRWAGLS